MYCKGCSANIPDGSISCDYCGLDLIQAIDPTASSTVKEPSGFSDRGQPRDSLSHPSENLRKFNVLNIILISLILIPACLYLYYWWLVPRSEEVTPTSGAAKRYLGAQSGKTSTTGPLVERSTEITEKEGKEKGLRGTEIESEDITSRPPDTKELEMGSSALSKESKEEEETDPASEVYNRALKLNAEGKHQEALSVLLAASEVNKGDKIDTALASTYYMIGMEAIKSKEFRDALDNFEASIKYDPKEAKYHFGLGLAYFNLDNYYQAALSFQEAINLDPENINSLHFLGEIYYRQNHLRDAVGVWKKALQLRPEDKKLAARLAKVLREEQVESNLSEGSSPNFVLRYDGEKHEKAGKMALELLSMAYDKVGADLDFYPKEEVTTILYSEEEFKDVTLTPDWTKGLFDGKIRLPIKGIGTDEESFSRVIFHEYTHAAIYLLTKGNVPTWLNEGMAIYEEGSFKTELNQALQKAVRDNALFSIKDLEKSFMNLPRERAILAYAQSYSWVKYVIDTYSLADLQEIFKKLGQAKTIGQSFDETLSISTSDLESDWRHSWDLPASR
ncbi:MAG: tetratricopeptide repeat protein [Candidatus Tectomicrobia bacterium]|uniref:Tetratricopeptide repeat protein n=1 Tax=Tectimicrobiota bacterium TaxID=2528274 RepID=A0A933GNI0_UNCTE|nr:tetratricopeptide repeat protein [Candidatus Tectomicrobia bacterium]